MQQAPVGVVGVARDPFPLQAFGQFHRAAARLGPRDKDQRLAPQGGDRSTRRTAAGGSSGR